MLYPVTKRSLDVLVSLLGLALLLPLGVVIALAIKLTDGGPVFFGQNRIGRFGQPFRIWKFRSMLVDARNMGPPVTKGRDPRITPIGRLLRGTKLDELPQLWNVLVGDMSLVGPRPEVPIYVNLYTPEQREILQLRPGITDLASILFRDEESLLRGARDVEQFYIRHCLPKKIELNLEYARHAGFLRDCGVIWLTFSSVALDSLRKAFPLTRKVSSGAPDDRPVSRVAIIGTGDLAAGVARDLSAANGSPKRLIALFDDSPHAWHRNIGGAPVVGMPECLLNESWRQEIDEVIIALPTGLTARRQELEQMLENSRIKRSTVLISDL